MSKRKRDLEGAFTEHAFHRKVAALQARYSGHPAALRSLWSARYIAEEIDFRVFRGDTAYLWQRSFNDEAYRRSCRYLQNTEPTLMTACDEDGAFGALAVEVDDKVVSRDLLDSVAELAFLRSELGELAGLSVLDIGAGYGRLAHRAWEASLGLTYACTDAIPESTLISEYYLAFRECDDATVVPLHQVAHFLDQQPVDLAINVHSFPECPRAAVEWWLRLLAEHEIRFLFLVPNTVTQLTSYETVSEREDIVPLLRKYGYRREGARFKYRGKQRDHENWLFQDVHLLYVRA